MGKDLTKLKQATSAGKETYRTKLIDLRGDVVFGSIPQTKYQSTTCHVPNIEPFPRLLKLARQPY